MQQQQKAETYTQSSFFIFAFFFIDERKGRKKKFSFLFTFHISMAHSAFDCVEKKLAVFYSQKAASRPFQKVVQPKWRRATSTRDEVNKAISLIKYVFFYGYDIVKWSLIFADKVIIYCWLWKSNQPPNWSYRVKLKFWGVFFEDP